MKKTLSLLLALALLLPGLALADTEVDVGIGVLTLSDDELMQVTDKADGGDFLLIQPGWSRGFTDMDYLSVGWSADPIGQTVGSHPETYAETLLNLLVATMRNNGAIISDQGVLDLAYDAERNVLSLLLYYTLDLTEMVEGLQLPLYIRLKVYSVEGDGSYLFSANSITQDGPDRLLDFYLERVQPKAP